MKVSIKIPGYRKLRITQPTGEIQALALTKKKRSIYIGRIPVQVFTEGIAAETEQRIVDLEQNKLSRTDILDGGIIF